MWQPVRACTATASTRRASQSAASAERVSRQPRIGVSGRPLLVERKQAVAEARGADGVVLLRPASPRRTPLARARQCAPGRPRPAYSRRGRRVSASRRRRSARARRTSRRRAQTFATRPIPLQSMAVRDRIEPTQGAERRPALRRRLVQGRAARPRCALRAERHRQDNAAACARRRDEPPGRRARVPEGDARRATRPAAAARAAADAARVRALGRDRPACSSRTSCVASKRRWPTANTVDATMRRYAEAQARLEHAGGYDWREHAASVLRGLGFADENLDRSAGDVLGR